MKIEEKMMIRTIQVLSVEVIKIEDLDWTAENTLPQTFSGWDQTLLLTGRNHWTCHTGDDAIEWPTVSFFVQYDREVHFVEISCDSEIFILPAITENGDRSPPFLVSSRAASITHCLCCIYPS